MSDKQGFGKRRIKVKFEIPVVSSNPSAINLMYLEHGRRPPGMCAQWPFCKCGGLGVDNWVKDKPIP